MSYTLSHVIKYWLQYHLMSAIYSIVPMYHHALHQFPIVWILYCFQFFTIISHHMFLKINLSTHPCASMCRIFLRVKRKMTGAKGIDMFKVVVHIIKMSSRKVRPILPWSAMNRGDYFTTPSIILGVTSQFSNLKCFWYASHISNSFCHILFSIPPCAQVLFDLSCPELGMIIQVWCNPHRAEMDYHSVSLNTGLIIMQPRTAPALLAADLYSICSQFFVPMHCK